MSTILGRRVWENAGSPEIDTNRLMVSIGTGLGSAEELVFGYDDMRARGYRAISPLTVQKYMPNGAAAAVGLERHAKAGVMTPISACASGVGGHRPRVAADRARRGRHGDLRRRGNEDRGGADRRVRQYAHRDVHQQRRPRRCVSPLRQGPRRLRVRRGRRPDGDRDRGAREGSWRQHPGPDHGGQHHLGRLPHGGAGPQRRTRRARDHAGDPARGPHPRATSTTSTPMPPAPRSATSPRARRSTTPSAATSRRSTRPSPPSATRWARSARWSRS